MGSFSYQIATPRLYGVGEFQIVNLSESSEFGVNIWLHLDRKEKYLIQPNIA
jgi:hypothetical protein